MILGKNFKGLTYVVFDYGSEHVLHLVVLLCELCHVLLHVVHLCQQRARLGLNLLYRSLRR